MSDNLPILFNDNQGRNERLNRLYNNPNLMDIICAYVANGGTLITLCETWDVPFGSIASWIHADSEKERRYFKALNDRGEWGVESVLEEVRGLAHSDIRKIFNPDGSIKPVDEWPAVTAKAVSAIEVHELWDGTGKNRIQIGEIKKIKFWDKGRALELLGKNLRLFVDRIDVSGKVTLADLIVGEEDKIEKS